MRVMLTVDLSDDSKYAFEQCLSMLSHEDEVTLVSVIEPLSLIEGLAQNEKLLLSYKEENATKALSVYGKHLTEVNIHHDCIMTRGIPKEVICKEVVKRNIDLLVMGRRGLSKVERVVVGSNTQHCTLHAKCAVLIFKRPLGYPHHQHISHNQEVTNSIGAENNSNVDDHNNNNIVINENSA